MEYVATRRTRTAVSSPRGRIVTGFQVLTGAITLPGPQGLDPHDWAAQPAPEADLCLKRVSQLSLDITGNKARHELCPTCLNVGPTHNRVARPKHTAPSSLNVPGLCCPMLDCAAHSFGW
eukprot:3170582-Rhodomonas_salina.3